MNIRLGNSLSVLAVLLTVIGTCDDDGIQLHLSTNSIHVGQGFAVEFLAGL